MTPFRSPPVVTSLTTRLAFVQFAFAEFFRPRVDIATRFSSAAPSIVLAVGIIWSRRFLARRIFMVRLKPDAPFDDGIPCAFLAAAIDATITE